MAINASYASNVRTEVFTISTSNLNDFANSSSANLIPIFIAGANGSRIDDIDFCAKGTITANTKLILYVGTSAATAVAMTSVDIMTGTTWEDGLRDQALVLKDGYTLFGAALASPGASIGGVVRRAGDF